MLPLGPVGENSSSPLPNLQSLLEYSLVFFGLQLQAIQPLPLSSHGIPLTMSAGVQISLFMKMLVTGLGATPS